MNGLSRKTFLNPALRCLLIIILVAAMAVLAHGSTQPYITGHQINFGTGNKYLQATDIRLQTPGPKIAFTRTYNSQSSDSSIFGYGWTAPHTERLIVDTQEIYLVQPGGRYVQFINDGSGNYVNETGARRVITADGSEYLLTEANGTIKRYDSSGRIISFTDNNGNARTYSYTADELTSIANNFGATLSFGYTDGRLTTVIGPQGAFTYGYDSNDNLVSVTKPDGTVITYIYDDANDVHNLTGVINEESVRIFTVEYDSEDRVIRSAKQNGEEEVTIAYPSTSAREVTDSLGVTTTYDLEILHGIVRVASFDGPGCSSCGSGNDMSYVYNDRLQVSEKTDAKGKVTSYTYDGDGNKLTVTEAEGTALEKATAYTYTAENRVKTITTQSIANSGVQVVTTMDYDDDGNLKSRVESGYENSLPISRTTTYSYNSYGQLETVDGPRTDVNDTVVMTYYPNDPAEGNNRGRLHTVTNGLGHVTTYSEYTIHGQAETVTDANGVATTRTFDDEGRLLSSTTGGLTTTYVYDDAGDLQSITRPGGRTITYGYDAAGRVNLITDNEGNSISYTYDTEGRKTDEEIHDPEGTLMRFTTFEYTDRDRIDKVILPGGNERLFDYDEVGNLVQTINATGLQSDMTYDLLSRLQSLTEESATTSYVYDGNGNITEITDARGNTTFFTYDDFNRRVSRTSPETGTTMYGYDVAGNLETITDALGRIVDFTYDALGRSASQSYGTTTIDFTYDQNANGIGRLSSIIDEYGSRSFSYNSLGQLVDEIRSIDTISYSIGYDYDGATGELSNITYPSGMVVEYLRGTDGRVDAVQVDGTTVIDTITHLPFGPLKSATLGSTGLTRKYDQRYTLTGIQAGSLDRSYTRDAEGHVTSISDILNPVPNDQDETSTYDTTSNLLLEDGGGTYSYDGMGNTTFDGRYTYVYDELNRLVRVEQDGALVAVYGFDASNRRIVKTVGSTTTHYLYDTESNLIAEATADGTISREYLYLDGELIAINDYQDNPGLYYAINDHLGTPQQLIQADGTIVWQAAYLPFGSAQVTVEQVVNNIRFPGQYYDQETGLHYNWHRYYDPETGRYISADPIGLAGEDLNLYSYVGQDPINWIDPEGLSRYLPFLPRGIPDLEEEYRAWEYTLSPHNIKEMAKRAGRCLVCVATCSGRAYILSKGQDTAAEYGVRAAKKAAKRKAAKLAAKYLAKGLPAYKVISGIQLGSAVVNCTVECKKKE